MRAIPRILAATTMTAALALLPLPLGAQEGGTAVVPRAEAQASALLLSILGQEAVISAADSAADAAPSGLAQGTGGFIGSTGFGQSEAAADADTPTAGSPDPVCSELALPDSLALPIGAVTACSTAQAAVSEGGGSATATGLAADIEIGSTADLAELGLPIDDLTDTLIDPLLELIGQLPLPGDLSDLDVLLDVLLSNPLTLATIQAGTTESTSTASPSTASAAATSEGVRIDLLDSSVLGPLATIVIGQSTATATFQDGVARSDHALAPVTVELGLALATALGTDELSLPVPEGAVLDLPLPAPLQSRITIASGTDTVDGLSARSTGSTVRLDLFTGLGNGGIVLAASDTAAAVEGVAAETEPPAEPPTDDPDTVVQPEGPVDRGAGPQPRGALPRTGGDGRWIPIGALLAVSAGVALFGFRRSRSGTEA